jgi:hypothetical protein
MENARLGPKYPTNIRNEWEYQRSADKKVNPKVT